MGYFIKVESSVSSVTNLIIILTLIHSFYYRILSIHARNKNGSYYKVNFCTYVEYCRYFNCEKIFMI